MAGLLLQRVLLSVPFILAAVPDAKADRAGFYLGAGATVASYRVSTSLESNLANARALGWRAEFGYIWDPGRSGGFLFGVAGTYNRWGEVEDSDSESSGSAWTDKGQVSAAAVVCVFEQELARWVDFVFKIGPAYGHLDTEETYIYPDQTAHSHDDSGDGFGGEYVAGFAFFPTTHFAIEMAAQGNWFLLNGGYFDGVAVGALSLSLQYRF